MQSIAAIIIGYLFGSMLSLVISGRNLLESQQLLKQSKHLHEVGIALMNEALKTEISPDSSPGEIICYPTTITVKC